MRRLSSPLLWACLLSCLSDSLAGVQELRLPVPTSETIALVAREMGATTFQESVEEQDSAAAESNHRVQRKLSTGIDDDIEDNTEYQEYQGVMGRPGVDFPVLPNIPTTSFSCRAVRKPGYYADLDTDCQVFHICDGGRKISFLCPNGTIFRQSHLICDWWFRVDCGKSVELYEESAEQLAADQKIYRQRAEAIHRAMHKGPEQDGAPPQTREPVSPEEQPPSTPRPDTRIDEPLLVNAKLNYENRQNAKKQQASQNRKQPRPETVSPFESNSGSEPARNQPQYKSAEDIRGNRPIDEEREQQVLSETASFASSKGNRQFFQGSFMNPSSQSPQQNTVSQSASPSQNEFTSVSSNSPSPSPEGDLRSSTRFSDNVYRASTEPTPVLPQRNYRPSNRLVATSSQNSNLRPGSARSNSFRNNKQQSNSQSLSPQQQQPNTSPQAIPQTPSQNSLKPSPSPLPQQNSFIRPSPDLIPPETDQSSFTNPRLQPQSNVLPSSKTYVQLNRNRYISSTTKRPNFASSTVNRFSSPTTIPPVTETAAQRRQKQRRFTSTTQKPVFTVKFRPSNSFSYVELERSRGSQEQTTPPNVVQSSSTLQQDYSSAINNNDDKVEVIHFNYDPNSSGPYVSTSSYSTSSTTQQRQPKQKTSSNKQSTTSYTTSTKPKLDRTSSLDPTNYSFSTYTSTPSYSPTVPTRTSIKERKSKSGQKTTPSLSTYTNQEPRLDKIASFSNIDPAEINLLPSNRKPVDRKAKQRVPESSGPNALHTLALYYATSESDSGTTPAFTLQDTLTTQTEERLENLFASHSGSQELDSELEILKSQPQQKTKISDEILLRSHSGSPDNEAEVDGVPTTVESADAVKDLSTVLTKATKDSYSFLFNETTNEHNHSENIPCTGDDVYDLDATQEAFTEKQVNIKNDVKNDLDSEQSRGIVQPKPSTKKPIPQFSSALDDLPDELKLRDSTDLRELAQVFSRALSAYLEDPDSFRRILSEVRPTEPPSLSTYGSTLALEENEDEVLDFSDASNSGPRIIANNQNSISNQQSINSIDIEQINDLARTNSNITEPSTYLSVPPDGVEETDTPLFTTANPTSLAVDINFLLRDSNNTSSERLIDDTYYPTAGGVDDRSRPRYGGFHNNSASDNYKAYGAEVPDIFTGKPIVVDTTYVTGAPEFPTTIEESGEVRFRNKNFSTAASNQIDIDSIPDQLGIVPAEDINSLIYGQKDCNDPSHDHENGFRSESIKADVNNKNNNENTEDEIYGRGTDQEKLLVASGSQSLVSRDNYVRLIGAKQEYESKPKIYKGQITDDNYYNIEETATSTLRTTTVTNRGSVRFGPPLNADRSDISSFKRRPNKEVAFQNVNLGNGVTLERTKTVRYSTPEIKDLERSTLRPLVTEVNINPISINEELGFVGEEVMATTEHSLQTHRGSPSVIRATTYHPITSSKSDFPRVIPPRGSLRDSWQWNSNPSTNLELSTTPENYLNTVLNENFGSSMEDFSTFASTLLPPNVTLETAKEEMLEKKAEEIFGKLNKTSADMLMNVMNQAESNMTVRRLVLLLVADRNGRGNKSFEESRSQLIQALLKTSEKISQPTNTVEQTTSYTEEKKITSKKTSRTRSRLNSGSSQPSTTQSGTNSRGRGPKAYRGSESDISKTEAPSQKPEPQFLRSPNLFPQNPAVAASFGSDPDARAVELLKSLYHLAARWG